MTLIDRDRSTPSTAELEALARLEPHPSAAAPTDATVEWSLPARVLLAAVLAGAGAIHLAMVPSHAAEWLPEGIAFAVAAWIQLGLAAVLLARPSRGALRAANLASLAFVAAWAVSRIWGWPVGPDAGVPHAASFVDGVAVVLELVAVVVGYELLAHPRLGARLSHGAQVALSVLPVGALVLATLAIASPSAADHGHTHGGTEVAAGDPAGPAAAPAAAGGHDHDAAATGAHDHASAPADDKGLSQLMNGQGEGGGHTHNDSVVPLDPDTQAKLDAQLAKTRVFVERYPTVKDAEAAGYHRQGPFSPGLGAHYMRMDGAATVSFRSELDDAALAHPTLIYDGVDPDSKLAGFMYNIFSLDTQHPPEGFVGPNDHWHFHTNVCLVRRPDGGVDAPLGADTSATPALCDKYGGRLIANTGYMVHVWTVPGYESPQGTFSNLNQKITCPNGTYYTVPMEEIGTRSNICRDVAG